MTWPEIWKGDSLAAKSLRAILTPLSWGYGLGWRIYEATYKLGIKKAQRPHSPVICVGNLVVGGSGKTPIVVFLARLLVDLGYEVVISASGYGSPASEAAQIAPDGELDPKHWGDEPSLLREELPDIPLIVGRRRVLAAQLCATHFPGAVMLMDDGAQHMPLARDLTFLVQAPGSNLRCLPAGPYRQPPGDVLFFERGGTRSDFRGGMALDIPCDFEAIYSDLNFEPTYPTKASVLCAIGNPDSFLDSLKLAGVEIGFRRLLPDHDPLDAHDLWEGIPAGPVVVTLKDWVKIRNRDVPEDIEIVVARRVAALRPEIRLRELLKEICG